jgi:phenylpropionate dioxygenase-like ring-hydroxylating dioxygenase large terminal subunit
MTQSADFRIHPDWFWSKERAEKEWTHVWSKLWHMGPRVEELSEPGDMMVHSLGRESLLFVRDRSGIRGHYNVCRHRGNRLVLAGDGPSYATELACAFHGWRYGLNGQRLQVPYEERFECQAVNNPDRKMLKSFRVESFAGWVWFTLDDNAPSLMDFLGPIAAKLETYKMERAKIIDYKTFEFEANWKTVFDAFNESYHFQTLHSEILAWGNEDAPITLLNIHSMMVNEYGAPSKLYAEQNALNPALTALLEQNGIDPKSYQGGARGVRRALQVAKRSRQESSIFPYKSLTDSQLTDAYHFMLFPSTHFNLFPEFYVTLRYRPHPSGDPEKMYFDFIMCAPLEPGEVVPPYEHRVVKARTESVADVLKWGVRQHPVVNQVLGQDVDLVETVQRGMRSQSFIGPLLSSDERRIAHFHQSIDDLISERRSLRELIAARKTEADAHSNAREPA